MEIEYCCKDCKYVIEAYEGYFCKKQKPKFMELCVYASLDDDKIECVYPIRKEICEEFEEWKL